MDSIIKAGLWETTIGGVKFISRRKSTAVMVKARGFGSVAGQLEAAGDGESITDRLKLQVDFTEACMRAALVEPHLAPSGEPTIEGVQYAFADLEPFADQWLVAFMGSAVEADPTPPSCEA